MPHAFISYIRENSQIVDRLAEELRRSGVTVWLDRESLSPGVLWSDAIKGAITEGGFFLACFSREFSLRQRTYMTEELMLAADQFVRGGYKRTWFIPLVLNECEVPDWPITSELTLRSLQQVDLAKDWREGIRRLITIIQPVRSYGKLRERPYEPRLKLAEFKKASSPLVAIDFGTSYSSIAVFTEKQGFVPVPDHDGRTLIPSVVTFMDNWDYLVGFDAVSAAEHAPDRSITNVKRLLGSDFMIQLAHKEFAPETIASLIIEMLKRNAERYLGAQISTALAAIPTDFSIAQSQSLIRAYRLAGLEIARLVGEPNAATLSLLPWIERKRASESSSPEGFLVIDMGGGTTDISVANVEEGLADIVATVGDASLGGVDYDTALFRLVRRREIVPLIEKGLRWSTTDDRKLLQELSRGKILLSNSPNITISLGDFEQDNGLVNLQFELTRSDMRAAVADLDRRVATLIDRCIELAAANRNVFALDAILLAGQGSKIYTVSEMVRKKFPKKELVESLQEKSVLTGLATQSGVLSGECKDVLLIETVYRPLLLRCVAGERKEAMLHVTISCRSAQNTSLVNIGLKDVPSKVELKAKISGSDPATLVFLEASTADPNDAAPAGEIILEKVGDGENFTIFIDIDANRVVHVKAVSSSNQILANKVLSRVFNDTSA